MKQLHPRTVWLFFISSISSFFIIFLFSVFYITNVISEINENTNTINDEIGWIIIIVLVSIILSYVWAKLSYHFYRYELREDGFRIEMGVITKKYVTIPYDRIQNVDIYRGILARILGLSALSIQTAGSSRPLSGGGYSGGAEGSLPGLSINDAEQLRDELIRLAKQLKNQGL
ncbi:PH domain-containing protein [Patescibacteria group bacterium]|nr:PH domain-containing protein [Patescibacteria group bacterium]MBU4580238.1 PH domain-containing protein [Patescibacteria group bacterium]